MDHIFAIGSMVIIKARELNIPLSTVLLALIMVSFLLTDSNWFWLFICILCVGWNASKILLCSPVYVISDSLYFHSSIILGVGGIIKGMFGMASTFCRRAFGGSCLYFCLETKEVLLKEI